MLRVHGLSLTTQKSIPKWALNLKGTSKLNLSIQQTTCKKYRHSEVLKTKRSRSNWSAH